MKLHLNRGRLRVSGFFRPFLCLWLSALVVESSALAESSEKNAALHIVSAPSGPVRSHLDLEVGYFYRSSSKVFGENGLPEAADPQAAWTVHELSLSGRYGLTTRTSLYFSIPILSPSLTNEVLDAPLENAHPTLGDTTFEMQWRMWERRRPYGELRWLLHGLAPTGLDTRGPSDTTILTGTGIPELGIGLLARRQVGPTAIRLCAGYTARISQVVSYVVPTDGSSGEARFHPGNQADARLAVELEPARFGWIDLDFHAAYQGRYGVGTTEVRWFPSRDLDTIAGSEGFFADAGLKVVARASSGLEFSLQGRYRFLGRTLPEFAALGLEAYSPLPGFSGGGAMRMYF